MCFLNFLCMDVWRGIIRTGDAGARAGSVQFAGKWRGFRRGCYRIAIARHVHFALWKVVTFLLFFSCSPLAFFWLWIELGMLSRGELGDAMEKLQMVHRLEGASLPVRGNSFCYSSYWSSLLEDRKHWGRLAELFCSCSVGGPSGTSTGEWRGLCSCRCLSACLFFVFRIILLQGNASRMQADDCLQLLKASTDTLASLPVDDATSRAKAIKGLAGLATGELSTGKRHCEFCSLICSR